MKKISLLALAAISLTSCWTRIWTVAPTEEPVVPVRTVYTTQVTTPAPKQTTTTTVTVTALNADLSFYLDLNAVAGAFAESRTIAEFERLLNSSRYMINNLDLNRDGYIDYLRVLETRQGLYHAFLIQACLAPSVYQDVATLVAERRADALYVEVIGDRYLYGYNYIVRPVFVKRPPLWDVFGRPAYTAWTSPYHHGNWPSYYTQPKPIYLNHYQAYVKTYMDNHSYFHHCDYPTQPFYTGYTQMTQPYVRHDYQTAHPEQSFDQRIVHERTANGSGVSVRNAGQLRTETQREASKTTTSTTTTSSTASKPSTTSTTTTRPTTSGTSSRHTTSTTTTVQPRQSSATTTVQPRQSATTTVQQRQPSTSVESRVNKSGTTRTTIKTTDATGRTTTVKRESSNVRESSATRSGSTTGTTTRSSQGSTSGSSPRTSQRER